MSTSQDPNPQGGSLTDMAVEGTTVPSDSATQRTIPSVPRPDQTTALNDPNDLGTTDLAGQADNTNDMPKSVQDNAPTADIITGTGDAIPSSAATKNLHELGNPDASKGHARDDKHAKQKRSDQEQGAALAGEDAAEAEEVVDGVVGGPPPGQDNQTWKTGQGKN
ncbi:MAG: hypothetical protein L6R39_007470 [Caloplaca ligustica]|nr:MAG: hypothetical protein L6R39_007470 [Caloplaca ligustica]